MFEEILIRYRLEINKILYEEEIISLEVYRKMERYLINKSEGNILI